MTGSTVTERVPLSRPRLTLPFDQLLPRLAPWWLLQAARTTWSQIQPRYDWRLKRFGQLLAGRNRSKAITYCAEDFVPVLQHAPDMVEQWLEGCTEATDEIFSTVFFRLEEAYIALCEALLAHDPDAGLTVMSKTLCAATMITRYNRCRRRRGSLTHGLSRSKLTGSNGAPRGVG